MSPSSGMPLVNSPYAAALSPNVLSGSSSPHASRAYATSLPGKVPIYRSLVASVGRPRSTTTPASSPQSHDHEQFVTERRELQSPSSKSETKANNVKESSVKTLQAELADMGKIQTKKTSGKSSPVGHASESKTTAKAPPPKESSVKAVPAGPTSKSKTAPKEPSVEAVGTGRTSTSKTPPPKESSPKATVAGHTIGNKTLPPKESPVKAVPAGLATANKAPPKESSVGHTNANKAHDINLSEIPGRSDKFPEKRLATEELQSVGNKTLPHKESPVKAVPAGVATASKTPPKESSVGHTNANKAHDINLSEIPGRSDKFPEKRLATEEVQSGAYKDVPEERTSMLETTQQSCRTRTSFASVTTYRTTDNSMTSTKTENVDPTTTSKSYDQKSVIEGEAKLAKHFLPKDVDPARAGSDTPCSAPVPHMEAQKEQRSSYRESSEKDEKCRKPSAAERPVDPNMVLVPNSKPVAGTQLSQQVIGRPPGRKAQNIFLFAGLEGEARLPKVFPAEAVSKGQENQKPSSPQTIGKPQIKPSEKAPTPASVTTAHGAQPLKASAHLSQPGMSGAGEALPQLKNKHGAAEPSAEASMVKLSEIREGDDNEFEFPAYRQYTAMFQSPQPAEVMSPSVSWEQGELKKKKKHKSKRHKGADVAGMGPEGRKTEEPSPQTNAAGAVGAAPEGNSQAPHAMEHDQDYGYMSCCLTVLFVLAVMLLLLGLAHVVDITWSTVALNNTVTEATGASSVAAAGLLFCSSELCNREADYIKSLLEGSTAGPCENFYEHVCGSWATAHPLGKNKGTGAMVSTDTIIQDQLVASLLALLPSTQESDVSLAVSLYNACADRSKESSATASVTRLLSSWAIKQWPREAAATTRESWTFAGQIMRDLGLATFLDMVNGAGPGEATVVELSKPKHVFSCNDALRPSVVMQFRDAVSDIASAFSERPDTALIDEIMTVFIRLASSPREPSVAELEELKYGGYVVVKLSEVDAAITEFLRVAFDGASMFDTTTTVKLKSSRYVRNYLPAALRELPARAVMNYEAFLALVRLAPFLPEKHSALRQLFFMDLRGRTLADAADSSTLCLMAVETVLPSCLVKLSASLFRTDDERGLIADRLAHLENVFSRRISNLAWISEYEALVHRYQLKRRRVALFGHGNESCVDASPAAGYPAEKPAEFYHAVARSQQRAKLQAKSTSSLPPTLLSPMRTHASYDASRRRVPVPVALFNASVPSNDSLFTLHLSRYAVRFYHALVERLFDAAYESDSLGSADDLQRRLELLLNCFEEDLGQLPRSLRRPTPPPDPALSRGAVLEQTVALQIAYGAFKELLAVQRSQVADRRYAKLPDMSSERLFLVYYALDNCESSDEDYLEHEGHLLPAAYRVNLPLRHLVEFAHVFGCSADSEGMTRFPLGRRSSCAVVLPDSWTMGGHRR
ncbi:uncharacterized protein [Dermacentor andersoni]|uniref:uncharacterized protein n=1 Tax=Dermacentor andersoni TaxID=34620 RepID=UPI002417EA91|nr:uncharacterized protein LOC126535387 [Dermacentor andersoni]